MSTHIFDPKKTEKFMQAAMEVEEMYDGREDNNDNEFDVKIAELLKEYCE